VDRPLSDQNARFLNHLRKIEATPAGYAALHLHISGVGAGRKTRDNMGRAIGLLNELAKRSEGTIFLLKNFDLVLVGRGLSQADLGKAAAAAQALFLADAPVGFVNAYGAHEFRTMFDLGTELPKLMRFAEVAAGIVPDRAPEAKEETTIDLQSLGKIKVAIQNANLDDLLFSQPVYALEENRIAMAFQELYVSIAQLQDRYCPGISITSRRWLFADLTEDLDAAVLQSLGAPDELTRRRRFSLNLNLATLSSQAFETFDTALQPSQRAEIIVEIGKSDFIENAKAFQKVAAIQRGRGYKFLLDGLDPLIVSHLDLAGLGFDFAKMFWSQDMSAMADAERQKLAQQMARSGVKFVLARCDSAESVRFAKALRFAFAQGRLIDQMVRKNVSI
jgi:EAL domain-containing protein (putative c-di-GMP-specific phosphodiesterase class I)